MNRLSETLLHIFGGGGGDPGNAGYPQRQYQHQQPLTTYQSPVNGGSSMYVTQSTAAHVSNNADSPAQQGAMFMVGNDPARSHVQEM